MGIRKSLKKKDSEPSDLDRDILLGKIVQYDEQREIEKDAKKIKSSLSEELKASAIAYGKKEDRSHVLTLGNYKLANRAAVSDVIDAEAALQFLESRDLLEDCTTRILNKEAIEMCVQSGEITVKELQSFMTEKVSFKIELKKIK